MKGKGRRKWIKETFGTIRNIEKVMKERTKLIAKHLKLKNSVKPKNDSDRGRIEK